ncbi:MAG: hypothetical protein EPN14_06740 [Gallionella sp.]|nr:MAG: hypothetical protein EPN14_06740 [Gallionella sp.]
MTKPGWAQVTMAGRHKGLKVIGASQRPASIDADGSAANQLAEIIGMHPEFFGHDKPLSILEQFEIHRRCCPASPGGLAVIFGECGAGTRPARGRTARGKAAGSLNRKANLKYA